MSVKSEADEKNLNIKIAELFWKKVVIGVIVEGLFKSIQIISQKTK